MQHGALRALKVLVYSYAGLKTLWKGEESFRQEVLLGGIAWGVLFYLGAMAQDLMIFTGMLFLLFCTEALNTGLERIADKIDSSINPFTKEVKDLGAVAVFFIIIPTVSWFLYVLSTLV